MTCISAYHELKLSRVPGGVNVIDSVPDSDTATSRKVFIKKYLNGVEVLPQVIVPPYTGNVIPFFLQEGFSYSINHEKTCADGSTSKEYWGTVEIPKIDAPNKIDVTPAADHADVVVSIGNNYATLARYRRKGTLPWYTVPGPNKTDKFTMGPLLTDTDYEGIVCFIQNDRVTQSAFTEFTFRTQVALLTNIVLGPVGQRYFTCDAPLLQTGCKTQVNGANDWYDSIQKGSNIPYGLGKVLAPGDVVTIIYEGKTYTIPVN